MCNSVSELQVKIDDVEAKVHKFHKVTKMYHEYKT